MTGHGRAGLPGTVVDEPGRILAQQHVGVDERAAAQPAGDERPRCRGRPTRRTCRNSDRGGSQRFCASAPGAAGKRPGRVAAAPLEHQDRPAGLGQAARRGRGPETGAHDYGVETLSHACRPSSRRARRRPAISTRARHDAAVEVALLERMLGSGRAPRGASRTGRFPRPPLRRRRAYGPRPPVRRRKLTARSPNGRGPTRAAELQVERRGAADRAGRTLLDQDPRRPCRAHPRGR